MSPLEARQTPESGEIQESDIEIVTRWFEVEEEDRSRLEEVQRALERTKTIKCGK